MPVIGFPASNHAGRSLCSAARASMLSAAIRRCRSMHAELAPQPAGPCRGNLDPLLLVAGGAAMENRARETVAVMAGLPFVFNLGHGIVPETAASRMSAALSSSYAPPAPGH